MLLMWGEYLKAAEVNAMLDDPDAVFIDMRNHYEYEVGHFENAMEIPADTFREQLPKAVEMMQEHKDKKDCDVLYRGDPL